MERLNLILIKNTGIYFGPIKADIGFIACNTAHYFFEEFQKVVQFELVNILETVNLSKEDTIFCSPSTKALKMFGEDVNYPSREQMIEIENLIKRVNDGEVIKDNQLKSIVGNTKLPIFACTEISMLAYREGLVGIDTLDQTIDEVIRRIK